MRSSQIDHHFNRQTGLFYMATPHKGVPIEQIQETLSFYQKVIDDWRDQNLRQMQQEVLEQSPQLQTPAMCSIQPECVE